MKFARNSAALAFALAVAAPFAAAQNVKVTAFGSHDGELCDRDRAMVFEDPTGVRILYDVGNTLTGGDDARLGTVHLVLLSHAHGDHLGDRKLKALGGGTCAAPETVPAGPNSMTAEVAAAKGAALVMANEMGIFVGAKVAGLRGGKATAFCPQKEGVTDVPVAEACRSNTNLGGMFTARAAGAAQGVEVTIVYASHANNVPLSLISEAARTMHTTEGTAPILGPPTGYVVKFTNGLVAYLSGDTGIHTEMRTVVNELHHANLAVFNLGLSAGTNGAFAMALNEMIKPASVLITHPNEAVTEGGKLRPTTRAAALIKMLKMPASLAVSGRTLQFDGKGKCVAGC
jgi:L-ascorbate metabolism protein UlaG (beta-lactamase superfamily)